MIVPSSGIDTWKSDSSSSRNASNSSSARSISSISSTGGFVAADRRQQRPLQQIFFREDLVLDRVGVLAAMGLDRQQLALVVPFVERRGLVQPLVALQPDQLGGVHRRRAPWRPRSCRRRPRLPAAAAAAAAASARSRSQARRRRYSRTPPAARAISFAVFMASAFPSHLSRPPAERRAAMRVESVRNLFQSPCAGLTRASTLRCNVKRGWPGQARP